MLNLTALMIRLSYGNNSLNASGQNAEVWAAGLKYDANNIYLATTYSETQNMTVFGNNHIANKAQKLRSSCTISVRLRSASVRCLPAI